MGMCVKTDFCFEVIYACIVLHNVAIKMKDYIDPDENKELDDSSSSDSDEETATLNENQASRAYIVDKYF